MFSAFPEGKVDFAEGERRMRDNKGFPEGLPPLSGEVSLKVTEGLYHKMKAGNLEGEL